MELSDGIGIWGGALSTALAVRAWRKFWRVVSITIVPAFMDGDHNPPGRSLRASIQNRGNEAVYVRTVYLLVPFRKMTWRARTKHLIRYRSHWRRGEMLSCSVPSGTVCTPALPHHVEAGRALIVWVPHDALRDLAAEHGASSVIVGLQDELDRSFNSRPFKIADL